MLRIAEPLGARIQKFTNPLYRGADPWVIRHDGVYYSCNATSSNTIEVWSSSTLIERHARRTVWTAPRFGWNRAQVWAPELHYLRGRWYIYYAASAGRNSTHRMGVLESLTDDPQGPYANRGMLNTGQEWAIDGTVLAIRDKLYFIWSGWSGGRDIQHLYIAPMSNPRTISGERTLICPNDCHVWERVGESRNERGLHEAPQVLMRKGRTFLVYSCSGSWQKSYKLGMLELCGNPLERGAWKKDREPLFESTAEIFGVGHGSFTSSPDDREDWIVYHAKTRTAEGWRDRVVRAQRFEWAHGRPILGSPIGTGMMDAPSEDRKPLGSILKRAG